MKECPNGHEVSDTVKFCPKCGAEIQNKFAEEIRFCKKCGHERNGTEKFCSHCGQSFSCANQPDLDGFTRNSVKRSKTVSNSIWGVISLMGLLLVVCCVLFYWLNGKNTEEYRTEQQIREETHIEEEKQVTPSGIFNDLVNKNQNRWMGERVLDSWLDKGRTWCMFFYPINSNSGMVSLVDFKMDFSTYSEALSCKVPYVIQDNYIIFTARYDRGLNGYYEFDEFMLQIQPIGNTIKLVRTKRGKTQVFNACSRYVSDPIKE